MIFSLGNRNPYQKIINFLMNKKNRKVKKLEVNHYIYFPQ